MSILGWGGGGGKQSLHFIDSIWIQKELLDLGGKQVENHGIGFDLNCSLMDLVLLYRFSNFDINCSV